MTKPFPLLPVLLALLTACVSTRNIPEGELLYTGISEVAFNAPLRHPLPPTADSTGVIVALSKAYSQVEKALSGQALDTTVTAQQADSLVHQLLLDREALATARQEVKGVLAFAPNGSFMGSSSVRWPLQPRLWLYNRYAQSTSRLGRWIVNNVADEPIYVSTANPDLRVQVARNTLRHYGYFRGQAQYIMMPERDPRRAKVAYVVHTGPLFHLDSIAYTGFPLAADSLVRRTLPQSLLHRGDPFSMRQLSAERERLSAVLRNSGYYHFLPQDIHIQADTIATPLKVQLRVQPAEHIRPEALRRYHMGRTHITMLRNNQRTPTDTIQWPDLSLSFADPKGEPPIRPSAIRRYLYYRRGELYNQDLQQLGQEKLLQQGIFSQLQVDYVPRDSTGASDTLDVEVRAVLDKPYDAEFEGKVTSKSNGQVGPGVSFGMTKSNAFRNAEVLGLKAWASYEWQTGADLHGDRSLLNSYEYGASLDLTYPRLMLGPLGRRMGRRATTSTQFQINARWMNRAGYFGRVSLGANLTYTYQPRRNVKHTFSPLSLAYDIQLNTTWKFDSLMLENQALMVSMRDQFKPSMQYTYSWQSTRHAVRTATVSVEESGNLTSLIYRACGQPLGQEDKQLFGVPFAQFLKVTGQYTHQFPLGERSCIAARVMAGAVLSYGNSSIAPYSDLFTIGGANSIRAFAVRSIGPGRYRPEDSYFAYIDQVGDLKFEFNAEYRFPIAGNLHGALFVDAGNVWLLREDEYIEGGRFDIRKLGSDIALGTGLGLRYDLDFLVLRFDLGVGIHAPYDTGKRGYYNMPKFGRSLGYHFAVGYPF